MCFIFYVLFADCCTVVWPITDYIFVTCSRLILLWLHSVVMLMNRFCDVLWYNVQLINFYICNCMFLILFPINLTYFSKMFLPSLKQLACLFRFVHSSDFLIKCDNLWTGKKNISKISSKYVKQKTKKKKKKKKLKKS